MPKNLRFLAKIGDSTAVSGKKSDLPRCYPMFFGFFVISLLYLKHKNYAIQEHHHRAKA